MVHRFRAGLLIALVCLIPGAGSAQINPFGSANRTALSGDDYAIANRAAQTLFHRPNKVAGMSEPWHNGRTGSSGAVTLREAFTHKGMRCRKVEYSGGVRGAEPRAVDLNWCKTANGWKILS